MAKNFANLYASGNDSIALEQRVYLKQETTRGQLIAPVGADFLFTIPGTSVNFSQPVESSPHRSGRHHVDVIKQKTSTEWTIPTLFNIDSSLGTADVAEIDPAVALLWESLMGNKDVSGGFNAFNPTVPDLTFTIMEIGDMWAKQAPGAFVESGNGSFPGDGDAQIEWSGMAKTSLLIGIGKSTAANAANDITLESGEGERFEVGGMVQVMKDDGVTRSTDTPDGSPRSITAIVGDVVTVDGAVLTDSDGSVDPVYLTYYEPDTPVAINDPITGLEGSIVIAGHPADSCIRSASINMVNNHELQDFCFGQEGLAGPLFTPGGRFTAEVSLELNLNHQLVELLNKIKSFDGENIQLVLGPAAGRRLEIDIPKAIFPVPEISVPDTGTIPVTFTGNAYATNATSEDEVTVSFV